MRGLRATMRATASMVVSYAIVIQLFFSASTIPRSASTQLGSDMNIGRSSQAVTVPSIIMEGLLPGLNIFGAGHGGAMAASLPDNNNFVRRQGVPPAASSTVDIDIAGVNAASGSDETSTPAGQDVEFLSAPGSKDVNGTFVAWNTSTTTATPTLSNATTPVSGPAVTTPSSASAGAVAAAGNPEMAAAPVVIAATSTSGTCRTSSITTNTAKYDISACSGKTRGQSCKVRTPRGSAGASYDSSVCLCACCVPRQVCHSVGACAYVRMRP